MQGETPKWSGPDWPASLGRGGGGAPGTSIGMAMSVGMGTSPFGRSVDMVDVVTQLMEAGGALHLPPLRPSPVCIPYTDRQPGVHCKISLGCRFFRLYEGERR